MTITARHTMRAAEAAWRAQPKPGLDLGSSNDRLPARTCALVLLGAVTLTWGLAFGVIALLRGMTQ